MTEQRRCTILEVDLPRCVNTYGVAPCEAELGVTGDVPCYNCADTCQDVLNYSAQTVPIRFIESAMYLRGDVEALPLIPPKGVRVTPQRIAPGMSIGSRERGTATLSDTQSNDIAFGLDPYVDQRADNPWELGTFWPRMLARYPTWSGYECRLIYGTLSQEGEPAFSAAVSDGSLDIGVQNAESVLTVSGEATATGFPGDNNDAAIILDVSGYVTELQIENHTLGSSGVWYAWQRQGANGDWVSPPLELATTDDTLTARMRPPLSPGERVRLFLSVPDVTVSVGRIVGLGLGLSNVRVFHYVVESIKRVRGGAQIQFCDGLKALDGDQSLFPYPSNGVLSADIGTGTTPFTLEPAGIGSALNPDGSLMYPTSGYASIGDEFFSYTRAGDVITPTGRGLRGTEAREHNAFETMQTAYVADGETFSKIAGDILSSVHLPDGYVRPDRWANSVDAFNTFAYVGYVAQPTAVRKLMDELVQELGLVAYTDVEARRLEFFQIRNIEPGFNFTDDVMMSLGFDTALAERTSDVYVRYNRWSPMQKLDEEGNYRGRVFTKSADPREAIRNNSPRIADQFARWVSSRVAAEFMSDLRLGLYRTAPRELSCDVETGIAPRLGRVGQVTSRAFVDAEGRIVPNVPVIVVEAVPGAGTTSLVMREYRVNTATTPGVPGRRVVPLEVDQLNMGEGNANLRDIYNRVHATPPAPGDVVEFIATDGVIYGSSSASAFALVDGPWPEVENDGVTLRVVGLRVMGRGGVGGTGGFPGENGGPCVYTRVAIEFVRCLLAGGGGGGGSAFVLQWSGNLYWAVGGGGAGRLGGLGYQNGTTSSGGLGENNDEIALGGDGGSLGQPGTQSSTGVPGGAAGVAIDGMSFVTLVDSTVLGPTIN